MYDGGGIGCLGGGAHCDVDCSLLNNYNRRI